MELQRHLSRYRSHGCDHSHTVLGLNRTTIDCHTCSFGFPSRSALRRHFFAQTSRRNLQDLFVDIQHCVWTKAAQRHS
ncbi:hypothetical protein K474DRAFT_1114116 [Panus rudis PR-1116 ss-1]|nr:hypothetical protein K474DRAFT_1114116 [Panus rudis PR-1116 ss-1]